MKIATIIFAILANIAGVTAVILYMISKQEQDSSGQKYISLTIGVVVCAISAVIFVILGIMSSSDKK